MPAILKVSELRGDEQMIERIVCGTDLGYNTPLVVYHAVYMARQCDASVEIVHAVEPINPFSMALFKSYALDPHESHAVDQILASIKDSVVERLADEYMSGLEDLATISNVIIEQGDPAEVIIRRANGIGADMIVMGASAGPRQGLSLLGSCTARVLQMARQPVLTVPATPADRPGIRENPQMKLW